MNRPPGTVARCWLCSAPVDAGEPCPGCGAEARPAPQGYPQQPAPKKRMSTFSAVLLALIVFFVVIPLGSCVACAVCAGVKKGADDAQANTPVSRVEALTSAPTTFTVSIAGFTTKDRLLDRCVDVTISPPSGVAADSDFAARFFTEFVRHLDVAFATPTRLYKTCAEQFPTRLGLATCTLTPHRRMKNDAGAAWGAIEIIKEGYYNLDSLTSSDESMKDCLDRKGDWQGIDKGSDEYRQAVEERDRRELQKSLRKYGGP